MKNASIKLLLLFLLLYGCRNIDTPVDKSKLFGHDYRLFQGSSVWGLAKAVDVGDEQAITEAIKNGQDPNMAEPRFGNTLLMMAISNDNYPAVETLLKHSADPNKKDAYKGSTAMHYAAKNNDPKYLKLLLAYKGNPNAIENIPKKQEDGLSETVLNSAISTSRQNVLEKVRILVEAGADVNSLGYSTEVRLPIADAIMGENMDVLLYLLQHGADYNKVLYRMVDGTDVYILMALRKSILDLNSPEYQKKLEVIAFLKDKGLDYAKEPIPDYVLKDIKKKYPDSWQEYIKKY
eukprot:Opistho-2@75329